MLNIYFYQVKMQVAHSLSSSKPLDTNLLISSKAPRVGARVEFVKGAS